jgi:hypothetical protein
MGGRRHLQQFLCKIEIIPLFPVIYHLFADKRIRILTGDVAAGADFVPSGQQFFHFHFVLPSAGTPA